MKTKKITNPSLPQFLPHGWKTEVAKTLDINPVTVNRNIKKGHGLM